MTSDISRVLTVNSACWNGLDFQQKIHCLNYTIGCATCDFLLFWNSTRRTECWSQMLILKKKFATVLKMATSTLCRKIRWLASFFLQKSDLLNIATNSKLRLLCRIIYFILQTCSLPGFRQTLCWKNAVQNCKILSQIHNWHFRSTELKSCKYQGLNNHNGASSLCVKSISMG